MVKERMIIMVEERMIFVVEEKIIFVVEDSVVLVVDDILVFLVDERLMKKLGRSPVLFDLSIQSEKRTAEREVVKGVHCTVTAIPTVSFRLCSQTTSILVSSLYLRDSFTSSLSL